MTAPEMTDDIEAAISFIADQQTRPETACAYTGTLDDDLREDLEGLDQPLEQTLRIVRDESGTITGAAAIEWDDELHQAWVYGPWTTEETWNRDAAALLEAVTTQADEDQHEMYAEVANTRMATLADQLGWKPTRANHVYEVAREKIACADDEVRPVTTDDLPRLKELHDAEFPRTYASAEQLLDGDEYTTLVLTDGDALLGYFSGKPDAGNVYLDFVATAPAARRRGVGTRLIGALANALPGELVSLTVDEDAAAAIALYRNTGWTERSVTRAYRNSRA